MRFRFIVFRAQPKQDSIVFSIYLEQTSPNLTRTTSHAAENSSNNITSPLTSPLSDYDISDYDISSVPVPLSHTNGKTLGPGGQQSPPESAADQSPSMPSRVCRTIDRSWGQCEWLYEKIKTTFRLQVLPPFMERPSMKRAYSDGLYVERYRARIERWLNRLGSRDDISQSVSFDQFISEKFDDGDRRMGSKSSFSSLLMTLFGSGPAGTDRGFKIYSPIGEISEYDEDEEERRREYISTMEESARDLVSAIRNMHSQEESLAKAIVKVSLTIDKAYSAGALNLADHIETQAIAALGTRGGGPINPDGASVAAPTDLATQNVDRQRLQVSVALLHNSTEAHYWATKELGVWEDMNLVDVITEYCCLMVGSVKDVMNHSTQTLMMYETTVQRHQQAEYKANSLRVQYPSGTSAVKSANEIEAEMEREMELAHQEYVDSCDMETREFVRYERERTHGTMKALENIATVELEAARARCEELRSLVRRIRSVQLIKDPPHARTNIGPMLWSAAGVSGRPSNSDYSHAIATPRSSIPSTSSTASMHRHTSSMGDVFMDARGTGSRSALNDRRRGAHSIDAVRGANVHRAHTLDNADFTERSGAEQGSSNANPTASHAKNHSVFSEIDEEYFNYPLSASVAVFSTQTPPPTVGASGSADSLQKKKKWNGRISTMPFQGYDPEEDKEVRLDITQDRLSEIAVEAEMKAELVRSGILAQRQLARQKSMPNATVSSSSSSNSNSNIGAAGGDLSSHYDRSGSNIHRTKTLPDMNAFSEPPVLPAFQEQAGSRSSRGKNTQSLSLRHSSSYTGLSKAASQGPVSPSEYLQYSRRTLLQQSTLISSKSTKVRHGSSQGMGSRPGGGSSSNRSSAGMRLGGSGSSSSSNNNTNNNVSAATATSQRIGRDYKGKAHAYAT
ncbi:hypothetical protein IW140_001132 [Coemansia sp. RSA 1813]|nr:hypothetical protein EV178_002357 [Coemansia sp. RSA 1646]KAJ1773162.1 hypothetical protein LPJ74_000901 [Coemansia sp. RSA 1843]KAJ2092039.1 hypothetical protein IW138_001405 [Coemansia sp. RSA 986]KAJ2572092.1 hypothetical protein IW140_001132 [Coemansia sp. RSA 1813]